MGQTIEQKLSDIYVSNLDIIGEGFPAAFIAPRSGYIENFMLLGLPSGRDERYLHSDVRQLFASEERETYFTQLSERGEFDPLDAIEGRRIVVENGFCSEQMVRTLPDGVIFGSLRDAATRYEELVLRHYNAVADNGGDALTALNSAFMQDGAFLYVPSGVHAAEKFLIDMRFASAESAQLCFSRMLVVVEDGASVEVAVIWRTAGDTRFLVNGVREAIVGRDASLTLTEVNRMGVGSNLVLNGYVRQESGSRAETTVDELGEGFARMGYATDLIGRDAESKLWGLYLAGGEEHASIAVEVRHQVPSCRSYELVKGIASGSAVGSFSGLVYVAPGAQQTDAMQQNRNLQMSDTARIYTRPQLEIYADDVKCSHGSTIGQLDDEAVYYMRQRGIGEAEARRMQLFGFVDDIISRCGCESLCEYVREAARDRLETI